MLANVGVFLFSLSTGKGKIYLSKYPTLEKAEISTGSAACFPRHCCCRANPCDSMDLLNPPVAK